MTTDPRWTAETEKLLARLLHLYYCGCKSADCSLRHGNAAPFALAALADAGLLVPDGGEEREDLGYATDKGPRLIGWSSSPATIRRTITTWADGSMLIGPWVEVTDRG